MSTKSSHELTLRDRLSRLTLEEVRRSLGETTQALLYIGGKYEIDPMEQVQWAGDLFRLKLFDRTDGRQAVVTITLMTEVPRRLLWNCTSCELPCEHVGAAFSLILEEKTLLGLAEPPPEREPVKPLSDEELITIALREREERARSEKMSIRSIDSSKPWTDYTVTSKESGKTYRVALRGLEAGNSFCSCPDFRKNTLGTCKHILRVIRHARRQFSDARLKKPYRRQKFTVHIRYGRVPELRVLPPDDIDRKARSVMGPLLERPITEFQDLVRRLGELERLEEQVVVYPDAEELIQRGLFRQRIQSRMAEVRKNSARHPLRSELLKVELLPYQLDGIAFAVGAGRAVLADEMGLGKTVQGIGVAELLAREAAIRKVLIVTPASVKSQWRSEIQRFCGRNAQLVSGATASRPSQYSSDVFFTICNYEQVLRDILAIERIPWDLIILDEGQRIKNWEAKTARIIKGLKSPFALVLSGTPLENRLDELYSVVEFIDEHRLGPAFRFFNRHRILDEKGKVLGYKNLTELRQRLSPVLLRRTRESVMKQLPPRTTEILRIAPTDEQHELHGNHIRIVSSIVKKPYLSEMDLLRLRKALLMCRMAADSTYLVDKQKPGYSSKLEALDDLLARLFAEDDRKALLFSEWTTMLGLIEGLLKKQGLRYVRLDGSVPQKKRQAIVNEFQNDPGCRLFITTNAGSTGLNLQAANTVINVDLPWNPAVLEQRIGRAHRMGQKRPVQVFVLVTENSIEENLLGSLSSKKDLALAALDASSDVDEVGLEVGMEELKRRLEVLLGAKAEAPIDESVRERSEFEAEQIPAREKLSAAGGQLLGAAFNFLSMALPPAAETPASKEMAGWIQERLSTCMEKDEAGRPRITFTLPDASALEQLAGALARVLALGQPGGPERGAFIPSAAAAGLSPPTRANGQLTSAGGPLS